MAIPNSNPTPRSKGILSRAVPAVEMRPELDTYHIKALLLGGSKGGKTTSANTLPGKKLNVNTDHRQASLVGAPDTDVLNFEPGAKLEQVWKELNILRSELWTIARTDKANFPYRGIVIDGLSSLNRICMDFCLTLKKADGKPAEMGFGGFGPAQHHFSPQMQLMVQFIQSFLALPCHIVFTGHYDLFQDEQLKTLHYWPKIYGKTRTEIATWFDETYECYTQPDRETGKTKYYWRTVGFQRMDFLGSSLNLHGKLWESPFEVNLEETPCGFAKLLDLRFGKKTESDS